ncbi:MAG: hypothetical protein OES57_17490 [Acidimicrobiia bacterium]|nr:hypothetical protein [Acidimicrobiia bacterium]
MARIDVPEGPGLERERVWAHSIHFGLAAKAVSDVVYEQASFSSREREVARMRIAQINDCHI